LKHRKFWFYTGLLVTVIQCENIYFCFYFYKYYRAKIYSDNYQNYPEYVGVILLYYGSAVQYLGSGWVHSSQELTFSSIEINHINSAIKNVAIVQLKNILNVIYGGRWTLWFLKQNDFSVDS